MKICPKCNYHFTDGDYNQPPISSLTCQHESPEKPSEKVKEYCQCKEKPVRLISCCRNCSKEIESPPTVEEMLFEEE